MLSAAAEELGLVHLTVAGAPLEYRCDGDVPEQSQVERQTLRAGRKKRPDIGDVQRIQPASVIRHYQELRGIDEYLGRRELSVAVRIVVPDRRSEVSAGREPFAVLLPAAIQLDRSDVDSKVLDAVLERGRRKSHVEVHLRPFDYGEVQSHLRAPVLHAPKILEYGACEARGGRKVSRDERVLRSPVEHGEFDRRAIVEQSDVKSTFILRGPLDFQGRISGARQNERRKLGAGALNAARPEEALRLAEARALPRLSPTRTKTKLAQEPVLGEKRLIREQPRRVQRRIIAQSRYLADQTAVVVRPQAPRQEESVGKGELLTNENTDRLELCSRLIVRELCRGGCARSRARRNRYSVAVDLLEQRPLKAAPESRRRDERRQRIERRRGRCVARPLIVAGAIGIAESNFEIECDRQQVGIQPLRVLSSVIVESGVRVETQPRQRVDVRVRPDDEPVQILIRKKLRRIEVVRTEQRTDPSYTRGSGGVGFHSFEVLGGAREAKNERTEDVVALPQPTVLGRDVGHGHASGRLAADARVEVGSQADPLEVVRAENAVLCLAVTRHEIRQRLTAP